MRRRSVEFDLCVLDIHGAVQGALGYLTPAEIEEVVRFAIEEHLDDMVVKDGDLDRRANQERARSR